MNHDQALPAVAIRTVALVIMSYGYRGLKSLAIDKVVREQYGGHFQYLTIQGLALVWLTLLTSLIGTIFPSFRSLRSIKRHLATVALPLSIIISVIYWSLLLFMPQFILQSFHEEPPLSSTSSLDLFRIPLSLDLALHACPASFLLLDFFLFEKKYSKRYVNVAGPLSIVCFSIWYGLWVEYCGKKNDTFPYPFLTENILSVRIAIYGGATFLALLSFRFINHIHG
ncbi:FAR-17a/AIG1-like protein [Gymnopilus junonius]|uniref:FAR-17a/AIG1-like protein n=1 Tax=Gymnopilus junonius TaxID=109634 RepID=A0A9P5NRZ9_GYMJU|nr:FAR-17a/AIG1-like protein [Gymnopilus junonius]